MNVDTRVKKLEAAIYSGEHRGMEEIIEMLDLEDRANKTPGEIARLKRLSVLPLDPGFAKVVASLAAGDFVGGPST